MMMKKIDMGLSKNILHLPPHAARAKLRLMDEKKFSARVLGRSGLVASRLGLASSYGGSPEAFERAFEQGCNYFYWGSFRRPGMGRAIKRIASRHREKIITVLQTYSRMASVTSLTTAWGLKRLG